MIIRKMIIDDIEELALLYQQFWSEESDIIKMQMQFSRLQTKDSHIVLSAIEDDHLIGSVMGIVCEELYGDCKPFMVLENMVVDKKHRKKGVGKALLFELETIAKQRDCTQIILITESNRDDACAFYESSGFHPTNNKGYKKKIQ